MNDAVHNTASAAPGSPKTGRLSGRPLQVVTAASEPDKHMFELNEVDLEKVLLDPRVRNKEVVVLSVAGAFRKGKSFLLDFFLRYLSHEDQDDWMGHDDQPLEGFSWRGGAERETTGIQMWSEPFFRKLPNGETVAVILMDTQGAFDSQSTVKDCATVFALSTMLSSIQVYNISSNIQEDDLQHLQLFTEYGRLALEANSNIKPFQELYFLVRDWSYPYDHPYGLEGGKKLLEKRLEIKPNQHSELQQLRRHISACFDNVSGYLMPHPGLKVATNPTFDGRLSDIESDFKRHLRDLADLLLSSKNLMVKQIDGVSITGKDLIQYFKSYVKIYQSDDLPEPKSMLQATAEANNLAAVGVAKDSYVRQLEELVGGEKPYMSPQLLEIEHNRVLEATMTLFHTTKKMGGAEFSQPFADRLHDELMELYGNFQKHNESKNILAAARTPAVLFIVMVVCYVLAGFFSLIYATNLAQLCNLIMGLALIALALWAYVRYSGSYREVGVLVDSFADFLWIQVISPISTKVVHAEVQRSIRRQSSVTGMDKKSQ